MLFLCLPNYVKSPALMMQQEIHMELPYAQLLGMMRVEPLINMMGQTLVAMFMLMPTVESWMSMESLLLPPFQ